MKCGCPHGDEGRICGACEEFGEDDDYEYWRKENNRMPFMLLAIRWNKVFPWDMPSLRIYPSIWKVRELSMKTGLLITIIMILSSCASSRMQNHKVMPYYPSPGTFAFHKLFSTFPTIPWKEVKMFFAWTPLINSSDFTGIQTDVLTTAVGIISVVLIVLGIGILIRVLAR